MKKYKCVKCEKFLIPNTDFYSCKNPECKLGVYLQFNGDYYITNYNNYYCVYYERGTFGIHTDNDYNIINIFKSEMEVVYDPEIIIKTFNKVLDNLIFV